MVHRGEILEKAVRGSGMPITELARRLKKSRRYVYDMFENPGVSTDTILKIGTIIHHDFTVELQYPPKSKEKNRSVSEPRQEYTADYWKNKYLELLEKYNELLLEKLENRKKFKSSRKK